MARSGISYDDVRQAARDLQAQGLPPSVQRIRELLGTGSHSTINQHLQRWRQELQDAPRTATLPDIPDAVTTALLSFWEAAVQAAEENYQALRQEAEQQVAAAAAARQQDQEALQQIRTLNDELHQQLASRERRIEALDSQLAAERERRALAEATTAAERERAAAAETQTEQARQAAAVQATAHATQLEQLRSDSAARLHDERLRGDANEARLMQLLDQARTAHKQEQTAFAAERKVWQEVQTREREQREGLQAELAARTAELSVTERRLQHLESERDTLHNERLRLARLVETLRGKLKNADSNRRTLAQQLAATQPDTDS